jgi:hypothetical protein
MIKLSKGFLKANGKLAGVTPSYKSFETVVITIEEYGDNEAPRVP